MSTREFCAGAEAAVEFLRAAGVPYRDGFTIRPLSSAAAPDALQVIAFFDTARNEIGVLSYDASVAASRAHPPAFGMPMSEALRQSFVAHEVAHAVVQRHFAPPAPQRTASEYIAAVVQLGTLPPSLRDAILERCNVSGFDDASETGSTTLALPRSP